LPKLLVKPAGEKGLGTFAIDFVDQKSTICEYNGTLIEWTQGGCFPPILEMTKHSDFCFFFTSKLTKKRYCIDAANSFGPGPMINHSRKYCNVRPDVVEETIGLPKVFFFATRDINPGEELLFDYGDRNKDVLRDNPWLRE
jgi:histone-lysine N-methyltransferase SETD8